MASFVSESAETPLKKSGVRILLLSIVFIEKNG